MLYDFLNQEYFRNRVADYLVFLAILAVGFVGVTLFRRVVLWRPRRWAVTTTTKIDDLLVDIFRKMLVPLAYYGVFYLAAGHLHLNRFLERGLEVAGIFLLTVLVAQFLIASAKFGIRRYSEAADKDSARERALKGFMTLIRVVVWGLATVFLLDNLGFRINTVIAGLGIGGIAVALAAQNILGDLFAYFTIMFDRPFEIGDFIIVGEYMGAVDRLGVKTTRINSLGGEQINFRIYEEFEKRKIEFAYPTQTLYLSKIPQS